MPAVEQTYRDPKLLHKLFGVTSLVMLVATIWMFAADHSREWKPIQRTANDIEIRMTSWRQLQFTTDEADRAKAELESQAVAARSQPIPEELVTQFAAALQADESSQGVNLSSIREMASGLTAAAGTPEAESLRTGILKRLRRIIKDARFREDNLLGNRKFKSADRDAAVATLGLLLRDNRDLTEQRAKQAEIDQDTRELDALTVQYQLAKEHRQRLDGLLKQMTAEEDRLAQALVDKDAELKQLRDANDSRNSTYINWVGGVLPLPGKRFLELPILDAFNSPRKIDNLWSKDLMIDYNFSKVRRFDRCTTCHQALQKTMPGSAVDPAYQSESLIDFQVALAAPGDEAGAAGTPAAAGTVGSGPDKSAATGGAPGEPLPAADRQLEDRLGLRIATEGLVNRNDATVQFVRRGSPASVARAPLNATTEKQAGDSIRKAQLMVTAHKSIGQVRPGLLVGDVIAGVNGQLVTDHRKVMAQLLDAAADGSQLTVTVRRGMPNPYSSHPRLDLFVGSLSPHKMNEFACTICHDGQGSATAFKFASHTPNSQQERKDWALEHNWFENSHWIFPMNPERFAESACLKCHHTVTELEASQRFPDPPAPTVVHGYHLVRKYGCFGCHEINGYDGSRRIGPDLRLEPNVFAAALQLKADPGFGLLSAEERDWVEQLVDHPDRDAVRYRVLEMLERAAADTGAGAGAGASAARLSNGTLSKLTPLFRDIESPGTLRKAGPSLRFVGSKVDAGFLHDWIREPKHFRPSTRMPQFFGLNQHLEGSPGLQDAVKFEPIEILGLVTYLQSRSQPFEYLTPPSQVNQPADAARGKIAFQTRGCLACHNHAAFPDTTNYRNPDEIIQAPDLSAVGNKLAGENGQKWLYSWIKQPSRYHARTVMPDLFLDPVTTTDMQGQVAVTDPAADIVAYLQAESKSSWAAAAGAEVTTENLDEFVRLNLAEAFARHRADTFATKGIPESMRAELKGPEAELLVPDSQHADPSFSLTQQQKLLYIGNRTVAKFGCYACHDIPGFEDAKPIGTVLADWGRKDSARLAFEHISHYIEHGHGHAAGAHPPAGQPAAENGGTSNGLVGQAHASPGTEYASDADRDYYVGLLNSGNRAGFLYQKLKEPRSYDFHKTENKKYSERLRMPQFPFSAHEREAVVTFVLGLVADPPSDKYIFRPSDRSRALLSGREVLEKYNCGGCHILEAEKWDLVFDQGQFGEQSATKTFPYVLQHFSPEDVTNSSQLDRSGLVRGTLYGMPTVDDFALPIVYDDGGEPLEPDGVYDSAKLELPVDLWRPAILAGKPFQVGVLPVNIPAGVVERRYGTDGGFLAKYLLPHVVALEKQVNPAAKGTEAWGWLPPPLVGEGNKVQSDWLHSFLLNPYPIRPATFLRMPRFNLTPREATQLVNYFAAIADAEYPYSFSSRRQPRHLETLDSAYQLQLAGAQIDGQARSRLDDAMRVVVNSNYCVKCHLVGDFMPAGSDRAKAPNLAQVYQRLRPEYVRNWIANPKSYLPYTSMPVNIPYDLELPNLGGVAQDLFHGTSADQVDGLVDLLMNYDEYAKRRNSVTDFVKKYGGPPAPAPATAPAAGDAAAAGDPAVNRPAVSTNSN